MAARADLAVLLLLLSISGCLSLSTNLYSCFYNSDDTYELRQGKDEQLLIANGYEGFDKNAAAWGEFRDQIDKVGYSFLSVNTTSNNIWKDEARMKCAGYIEGALTAERIHQSWWSYLEGSYNTSTYNVMMKFTEV
jgi:hypothetical protein